MNVNKQYIEDLVNQIKTFTKDKPEVAIILGSGLSNVVDEMQDKIIIEYSQLKNMLIPSVEGHKNRFILGKISGKTIIVMQGRFHPYNGFTAKQCAMPIYLFKLLGVKTLIVTTACGGVSEDLKAGDLMVMKSHINLTGMNPLIGGAIIDYGQTFIDLTNAYNKNYINQLKQIANNYNIDLKEGVFAQNLGPTYETPAESEMLRRLGIDAVSMSTVLEVIAAKQCDIDVLGISCITNKVAGYNEEKPLNHTEVLDNANKISKNVKILIYEFISNLKCSE